MKFKLSAVAVAIGLMAGHAKAADSYEAAVADLAKQIVETSTISGPFTVGITNFYHVDNTCSYLSNELVTRMKSNLFRVSKGQAQVVSRHLLPLVLEEIKFNVVGPIDPSTAATPGKISGVQTLLIGNISERPDRLSVSLELIDTETAVMRAIAEADFPKTSSVAELIATRSKDACGVSLFGEGTTAAPSTSEPAVQTASTQNATQPTVRTPVAEFEADGFKANVVRAIYSKSLKTATFVVRFANTSEKPIRLAYTSKSLAVTDDLGTVMPWKDTWTGIKACSTYINRCTFKNKDLATELAVGKQAQLTFNVSSIAEEPPLNISMGMEIIFSPDPKNVEDYKLIALGMFDVPLEVK